MKNIESLLNKRNFIFINHDIRHKFPQNIYRMNIDQIYHLACPASPPAYQKDPIFTMDTL